MAKALQQWDVEVRLLHLLKRQAKVFRISIAVMLQDILIRYTARKCEGRAIIVFESLPAGEIRPPPRV